MTDAKKSQGDIITQNTSNSKEISHEQDLKRVPFRFRIAAKWILVLSAISEKTGQKLSNIVETIVTDSLCERGTLLESLAIELETVKPDILSLLEKLNPVQIYKLLSIYVKVLDEKIDFGTETSISPESKSFRYLDSRALLNVFRKFFIEKKLKLPTLEELVKTAGNGYKEIAAFGRLNSEKMSDPELKEILLAIQPKHN